MGKTLVLNVFSYFSARCPKFRSMSAVSLEWDREAAWKLCESFTVETVLNFGGTETEALSLKYYVAP